MPLPYNGTGYTSVDEVKSVAQRPGRVIVESIKYVDNRFQVALIDNPVPENDMNDPWVKEYVGKYGHEPNFF